VRIGNRAAAKSLQDVLGLGPSTKSRPDVRGHGLRNVEGPKTENRRDVQDRVPPTPKSLRVVLGQDPTTENRIGIDRGLVLSTKNVVQGHGPSTKNVVQGHVLSTPTTRSHHVQVDVARVCRPIKVDVRPAKNPTTPKTKNVAENGRDLNSLNSLKSLNSLINCLNSLKSLNCLNSLNSLDSLKLKTASCCVTVS
jgi:hypothetical protein